jgi:hypothetical protein
MSIFIGAKVKVIIGKYKGYTARVYSYTKKSCILTSDGNSTTIQNIIGYNYPRKFTGNIKRESIVSCVDWRSRHKPPSLYFIKSLNRLFHNELVAYCQKNFPQYILAHIRVVCGFERQPNDPPLNSVPAYDKWWAHNMDVPGWREEFWSLYCDTFHDPKPGASVKIQSILRMYLQQKDYLEILDLKPDGTGYIKVKEEFESFC